MSKFEHTCKSTAIFPLSVSKAVNTLVAIMNRNDTPKRIGKMIGDQQHVVAAVILDQMVIVALLGVMVAADSDLNEAQKEYMRMVHRELNRVGISLSNAGTFWVLVRVGTNIHRNVNPSQVYGLEDMRAQKPNGIIVSDNDVTVKD